MNALTVSLTVSLTPTKNSVVVVVEAELERVFGLGSLLIRLEPRQLVGTVFRRKGLVRKYSL